ncbi:hypothetical protein DNTS_018366 [Danionella cerebrum]|uniref:Ig-like domain-containing protein n=1 Tax=Danionella cerebrum TaxID=2873325 RepID=A0A553R041_9TELE|nr:hypothetical protein DNTS_018366 [Danionella translucida]
MMVSHGFYQTLWIFVCFGKYENVVMGLQLPAETNGEVGGSVTFTPENLPSTEIAIIAWQAETLAGKSNIVSGSPDSPVISPGYTDRVVFDKNSLSLELLNLTPNDSGTYTFTVTSSGGSDLDARTSLNVYDIIRNVQLKGPEEALIEGESSATITSEGSGDITSIEWMKDNTPLNPSENIIFSPDNRAVSISPVQRSDSGEYEVKYSNPVSSGTSTLRLTINYGPEDVSVDGPEVVDSGIQMFLFCSATSEPPASFSWTFNGTDTGVTTSKYIIEETDITNTGEYTCTAFNSITNRRDSQNHTLKVQQGGAGGGGLSPGAIAGIVIGVLLAVSGICGLIVYLVKTKKIPMINSTKAQESRGTEQSRQPEDSRYETVINFHKDRGDGATQDASGASPIYENIDDNAYENMKHGGLQFPVVTNGAVGRNVVFAPLNPPSTAVDTVSWQCTIAVILSGSPASPTISPEYTGRVRFDSNDFALELLDLTLKDAGTYSLILETAGSALFGGTSLQMYELISDMKLTGPEEELIEGESSATLTSRGSGNITSIEWMKDNTPLNPSENIIFSPDNRAVSISPVQRSDSGEYEVKYSNPVSSGTSTLRLTINYGPEDVSVEGPEVVDLGIQMFLFCSATSEPSASFSWTFNGTDTGHTLGEALQLPAETNGEVGGSVTFTPENLPSTEIAIIAWQAETLAGKSTIVSGSPGSPVIFPGYTDRIIFDKYSLELFNLTRNDSGTYTVTVTSSDGSYVNAETSVNVYEIISDMKLTGPEDELIEGESSATITSEGSGDITSIEWMKDNTPLNPSENIIFSPDNRAVSISPVQRSDSPEVVDLGVKITLSCSAMSLPPASFSWTFNGTDTGVTTNKYTIEETDITNTGEYTCTAFNSITNRRDSQNHTLKVQQGGAGGGGLSPGAIAGIVIGVLLAVSGICGLIVYLVKTKKIPKIELGSSREASRAESQRAEENEIHYADIRHNKRKKGDRVEMANISEPRTEYAEIRHEANSRENPPPYGSQR